MRTLIAGTLATKPESHDFIAVKRAVSSEYDSLFNKLSRVAGLISVEVDLRQQLEGVKTRAGAARPSGTLSERLDQIESDFLAIVPGLEKLKQACLKAGGREELLASIDYALPIIEVWANRNKLDPKPTLADSWKDLTSGIAGENLISNIKAIAAAVFPTMRSRLSLVLADPRLQAVAQTAANNVPALSKDPVSFSSLYGSIARLDHFFQAYFEGTSADAVQEFRAAAENLDQFNAKRLLETFADMKNRDIVSEILAETGLANAINLVLADQPVSSNAPREMADYDWPKATGERVLKLCTPGQFAERKQALVAALASSEKAERITENGAHLFIMSPEEFKIYLAKLEVLSRRTQKLEASDPLALEGGVAHYTSMAALERLERHLKLRAEHAGLLIDLKKSGVADPLAVMAIVRYGFHFKNTYFTGNHAMPGSITKVIENIERLLGHKIPHQTTRLAAAFATLKSSGAIREATGFALAPGKSNNPQINKLISWVLVEARDPRDGFIDLKL